MATFRDIDATPTWCILHTAYVSFAADGERVAPSAGMGLGVLHSSALSFLDDLGLPSVHPACQLEHPGPHSKPMALATAANDEPFTWAERVVTLYCQAAPALLGIIELLFRLLAFYVSPMCIAYLLYNEMSGLAPSTLLVDSRTQGDAACNYKKDSFNSSTRDAHPKTRHNTEPELFVSFVTLVGLTSSTIIMTDDLYVHELGVQYGVQLFMTTLFLIQCRCIRICWQKRSRNIIKLFFSTASNSKGSAGATGAGVVVKSINWFISFYLIVTSLAFISGGKDYMEARLDIPLIHPGFYYDGSNAKVNKIVLHWPEEKRTYDTSSKSYYHPRQSFERLRPTPWLITGDSRTGVPFLVNHVPAQHYHRVWVPSEEDIGEAVALDIAFPPDGIHRSDHPFYLISHGLNGGSHEAYVRDFVIRETNQGGTVAVMISRGLMDTPVYGKKVFHGARTSDVRDTAKAIKRGTGKRNQTMIGVGYSMGAFVLANYLARSGNGCHFDGAIAISGALDMRQQLNFYRSMRLWQPILAQGLRDMALGKFLPLYREKLTREQYLSVLRAPHVLGLDSHAVVPYNGYKDLHHYYADMSALGDAHITNGTTIAYIGRIANVSVPLCVVNSLDDPLIGWKTLGIPHLLAKSGSGNVMMLLTKAGGHVGWPLGLNPRVAAWSWMSNAICGFGNSVNIVQRSKVTE